VTGQAADGQEFPVRPEGRRRVARVRVHPAREMARGLIPSLHGPLSHFGASELSGT
jgi:hypothetical protein